MAHTPTMSVPHNIQGSPNFYYAIKAMLTAINRHNKENEDKIKTVLCPGMRTLSGEMDPAIAVKQMVLAYEHFLNPPDEINVPYIKERLTEILHSPK